MEVQKVQFLYHVLGGILAVQGKEANGPLCQLLRGRNSCKCTATTSKLEVKDSLQVYTWFLGGLSWKFDFYLNNVSSSITGLFLICYFISVYEKTFPKVDGKDEEAVPGTSVSRRLQESSQRHCK